MVASKGSFLLDIQNACMNLIRCTHEGQLYMPLIQCMHEGQLYMTDKMHALGTPLHARIKIYAYADKHDAHDSSA
jgi:hypothetical protein